MSYGFFDEFKILICAKWNEYFVLYVEQRYLIIRPTHAIKEHVGSNAPSNEVRDFAESIRCGRK